MRPRGAADRRHGYAEPDAPAGPAQAAASQAGAHLRPPAAEGGGGEEPHPQTQEAQLGQQEMRAGAAEQRAGGGVLRAGRGAGLRARPRGTQRLLFQAGGSTGLLMDLAANEKAVHADFFNDFEDLFDDDDIQ